MPQVVGGNWQNNVLVLNAAAANTLQFPMYSTYASTSGGQVAALMSLKVQSVTGMDNVSLKQQYATQAVGGSTASSTPFTSYTIPAGTLTPGLIYQVQLEYDAITTLNTTIVPGVPVGDCLATTPSSTSPPRLPASRRRPSSPTSRPTLPGR